jgi:hypothetical protein
MTSCPASLEGSLLDKQAVRFSLHPHHGFQPLKMVGSKNHDQASLIRIQALLGVTNYFM